MNNRDWAFLLGLILGIVSFMLLDLMPGSYRSRAVTAIAACEETLPRNKQCVVTAIPEEESR
jgi:hypothetical protein